jgi:hypothetical protein
MSRGILYLSKISCFINVWFMTHTLAIKCEVRSLLLSRCVRCASSTVESSDIVSFAGLNLLDILIGHPMQCE